MSASRQAWLPINHLSAEIAAYPIASVAALKEVTLLLDPQLRGATGTLWRCAEHSLVAAFPSFSLDELVMIRDRVWFPANTGTRVTLADYLRGLARSHLNLTCGVPGLNTSTMPLPNVAEDGETERQRARSRVEWRWLTFALPPDILLAALDQEVSDSRVPAISPSVAKLLSKGFAETHLHLGAAFDFPTYWVSALNALAATGAREDMFASPGAELNEGRDMGGWLLRAACARQLLASFLWSSSGEEPFERFLKERAVPRILRREGAIAAVYIRCVLGDLLAGCWSRSDLAFAKLRSLFARISGAEAAVAPNKLAGIQRLDPIYDYFPDGTPGGPTPEMRFIASGLRYITANQQDLVFAGLFWQVVRLRSILYRHTVQRPMTPGLQWFIRFYDRLKPGKALLNERILTESAKALGSLSPGLESLEMRTSPEACPSAMLHLVQHIDSAIRQPAETKVQLGQDSTTHAVETGIVLHFTKLRGGGMAKGRAEARGNNSHANPMQKLNTSGYRFAHFYQLRRLQAQAFGWLLLHYPLSLEILRGIDIATDELGVPLWVLRPLVRYVADAGHAAGQVLEHRAGLAVSPLRLTAHSGEDYIHLLSGLRRVDETIHYLRMGTGDRLGHAIALGVEPKVWSVSRGRLLMPREERLLDLTWEWAFYRREGLTPPKKRLPTLRSEIGRLSLAIFGKRLSPNTISQLVDDLHDERMLRMAGFPGGTSACVGLGDQSHLAEAGSNSADRLSLLRYYLTSRDAFQQAMQEVEVWPESEGPVLKRLQLALLHKVARQGLTVEVNPSSNLLIANLSDLKDHPLWRMRPLKAPTPEQRVNICIGSDDPITFATNLSEEYQRLFDALILGGCSQENALIWLEEARLAGMKARFTSSRSRFSLTSIVVSKPSFIAPLL